MRIFRLRPFQRPPSDGGAGPADAAADPAAANAGATPRPRRWDAFNKLREAPVLSLPLGLYSRSRDSVAKPDVKGPSRAAVPLAPVPPMTPQRTGRMQAKIDTAVSSLMGSPLMGAGVPHAVTVPPQARADPAACRAAIDAMFNAAPDGAPGLGATMLGHFQNAFAAMPNADPAASAREAALLTALALRGALGADAARARTAWGHLTADADPGQIPPAQARDVNDLLRAAAENDVAFDAVWRLMNGRGHRLSARGTQQELQCALQATSKLISLGVAPAGLGAAGIDDFMGVARQRQHGQPRLGSTEGPEVLACRALGHVFDVWRLKHTPLAPSGQAAYTAWRNGFRESGPGTDFNRAVHRLHKFTTWIQRAETPQQSTIAHAWSTVKHAAQATVGKRLSPMDAARHGTVGAELKELSVEQRAFTRELAGATQRLRHLLTQEAQGQGEQAPPAERRHQCIAQAAILNHWNTSAALQGRTNVKLDAAARRQIRAALTAAHPTIDTKVVERMLKKPLDLHTLRSWAAPLPGGADAQFTTHLQQAETHAKARSARTEAPVTIEALRQVAHTALGTEGVQFRHGGMAGTEIGLSAGLNTPIASVGGGAGPTWRYTRGRQATVQIGTRTIGSDIFIGTDRRSGWSVSGSGSVGVALGKIGEGLATFGAQLGLRFGRDGSQESGVSIRVSKNVPNHRALAGQVVDFLFQQATNRRNGAAIDAAAMWENFATHFAAQPDISVNFVEGSASQWRLNGGAAAGVRVGIKPATAGLMGSFGGEHARGGGKRREPVGHVTSNVADRGHRSTASVGASLTGQTVSAVQVTGKELLDNVRFTGVSPASWRQDFDLGTHRGQVRLTIENGRVQPRLSLMRQDHAHASDFLSHLESRRAQWLPELMGAPGGPHAAFNQFMQDVANLPVNGQASGHRVHIERRCLTEAAAARLNFLLPQQQLLHRLGPAGQDEAARTQRQIATVLRSDASWRPEKLAVSEVASATTEVGLELVGVLRERLQATSVNRYLLQLKPHAAPATPGIG